MNKLRTVGLVSLAMLMAACGGPVGQGFQAGAGILFGVGLGDGQTGQGCTVGAITLENFEVKENQSCTLNKTRIEGNLFVRKNATLQADGIWVRGNIQAEGARQVQVREATVGGSVQIKQGGSALVSGTRITGDLQYDEMAGPLVASSNTVNGNVQIVKNLGGVEVLNNRISGNLQCKENDPAPTGGGNTVRGSKEDQCVRL